MFPAQIEEVIAFTDGASSEYQVMIEAIDGRDVAHGAVRDAARR